MERTSLCFVLLVKKLDFLVVSWHGAREIFSKTESDAVSFTIQLTKKFSCDALF